MFIMVGVIFLSMGVRLGICFLLIERGSVVVVGKGERIVFKLRDRVVKISKGFFIISFLIN